MLPPILLLLSLELVSLSLGAFSAWATGATSEVTSAVVVLPPSATPAALTSPVCVSDRWGAAELGDSGGGESFFLGDDIFLGTSEVSLKSGQWGVGTVHLILSSK